jgi:hypothetical protein
MLTLPSILINPFDSLVSSPGAEWEKLTSTLPLSKDCPATDTTISFKRYDLFHLWEKGEKNEAIY